jgi:hypothetical protein
MCKGHPANGVHNVCSTFRGPLLAVLISIVVSLEWCGQTFPRCIDDASVIEGLH